MIFSRIDITAGLSITPCRTSTNNPFAFSAVDALSINLSEQESLTLIDCYLWDNNSPYCDTPNEQHVPLLKLWQFMNRLGSDLLTPTLAARLLPFLVEWHNAQCDIVCIRAKPCDESIPDFLLGRKFDTKAQMLLHSQPFDDYLKPIEPSSELKQKVVSAMLALVSSTLREDTFNNWYVLDTLYYKNTHHDPKTYSPYLLSVGGYYDDQKYRVTIRIPESETHRESITIAMSADDLRPFFDACDKAGISDFIAHKLTAQAQKRRVRLSEALDAAIAAHQ